MKRLYLLAIVLMTTLLAGCVGVSPISQDNSLAEKQAEPAEKDTVSLEETETYGVEIIGGTEESFKKLLIHQNNATRGAVRTVVNIDELPEDFLAEIPLSDNINFVGSITNVSYGMRGIANEDISYTIFLESDLPSNELHELYNELLESEGWQAKKNNSEGHGFESDNNFSIFCKKNEEISLYLVVTKVEENLTSLRLNVWQDAFLCEDMSETGEFGSSSALGLLPELETPLGAVIMLGSGGAGGGTHSASSVTRIKTKLGPEELLDHYNQQLKDSDWDLISQNNSDEEIWSKWSFRDDDGEMWAGFLVMVSPSEESNSWYITLNIFRD